MGYGGGRGSEVIPGLGTGDVRKWTICQRPAMQTYPVEDEQELAWGLRGDRKLLLQNHTRGSYSRERGAEGKELA